MSHYRRTPVSLWTRAAFRRLSTHARLLLLYLRTGPATTGIPGLTVIGEAALAEELRWETAQARESMKELEQAGLVRIDREARVVWVPGVIADDWPASSKNVLGWRHFWEDIPESPLREEAARSLRAALATSPEHLAAFAQFASGDTPAGTVSHAPSDGASGGASDGASCPPSDAETETATATATGGASEHPPTPLRGEADAADKPPPSSRHRKKPSTSEVLPAGFAEFWQAYPRRIDHADAMKAWTRLAPDAELQRVILAALEQHKRSDQWSRDEGRYIPHPATWINKRRWESQLCTNGTAPGGNAWQNTLQRFARGGDA
jgi:hypothetical protein